MGLQTTESPLCLSVRIALPGVNLIGDHTDYNEGFVLPLAVDFDRLVRAQPRDDGRVVLRSLDRVSECISPDGSTGPRDRRSAFSATPPES
jgi:galactokinase